MPLALVSALHWLHWNTTSLWEDKEQDLPLALSSVPAQLLPSLFLEAGKGVHPPHPLWISPSGQSGAGTGPTS